MAGNGILNLPAIPTLPNGAAPAQWVLNQIAAQSLYQGTWNADTNVPDLTQPAYHQNGFTFIVTTASTTGVVVSQPIPGIQGLTVYEGDNVVYSALKGQFDLVRAGGITLAEANSLYVPYTGGQMSGPLLLNANATAAMGATTLQQVQALVGTGGIPEAPNTSQLYGRIVTGGTGAWAFALPLSGGTLAGPLTLAANAVAALQAVPLQQLQSQTALYVPLAGGVTVTGPLTMGTAGTLTLNANASQPLQAVPFQQLTSVLAAYLPLTGGTLTGALTLSGNASTGLQAAPLQQVLPLAGGVMTGPLVLSGPGAAPLNPATVAQSGDNVGRNLLHNGLMNVRQRGMGTWNATGYTADRWAMSLTLDTSYFGINAVNDSQRAQIGDEAAEYLMTCNITGNAGATSATTLFQPIEDVRRLSGKTVTVSFYAVTSVAGDRLGASLDQNFGTGGSPSAGTQGAGQSVALTTAFARYSLVFAIPSTAGMTLGTNGDSRTYLNLWYSAGSSNQVRSGNVPVQSGVILVWGVQLEIGSVATPLEKLDPQQDLANCQRFYQVGSGSLGGYGTGAIGVYYFLPLPVTMRASPTMNGTWTQLTNVGSQAFNSPLPYGFTPYAVTLATGGFAYSVNWTASADL